MHTPIRQGNLLTCADCDWRVVLTTAGPFLRNPGDPSVDHVALLEAQQAQAEQLRVALLRRAVGWDVRRLNRLVRCIESELGI